MAKQDELEGNAKNDEQKLAEQTEQVAEVLGVKMGDVINLGDKQVKVTGFTAPEGDPSRAFITEELTPTELAEYMQRKWVIGGKVEQFIESSPSDVVDEEEIRKEWEKIYDETEKDGQTRMKDFYSRRYKKSAQYHEEKIAELEARVELAKDEAERQALQSQIVDHRESAKQAKMKAIIRGRYDEVKEED